MSSSSSSGERPPKNVRRSTRTSRKPQSKAGNLSSAKTSTDVSDGPPINNRNNDDSSSNKTPNNSQQSVPSSPKGPKTFKLRRGTLEVIHISSENPMVITIKVVIQNKQHIISKFSFVLNK